MTKHSTPLAAMRAVIAEAPTAIVTPVAYVAIFLASYITLVSLLAVSAALGAWFLAAEPGGTAGTLYEGTVRALLLLSIAGAALAAYRVGRRIYRFVFTPDG